ncbi:ABC transporter substrate-binding protein [Thermomicrobium sp. 4228-Ro]|uniref:ABC transporter substrate-binding protein n=1 Tax=Thermomicrobium sp. 4228-Ro TaxID=2993937 RepID=UPI00224986A3|nr:ABC transporter substrate-binding protein [Thermomicrobium sp. 4228-Ro]MCX2726629.1 ABC transporter substrate-binding protein [Thermomicrobium sp. 4228-Ro]
MMYRFTRRQVLSIAGAAGLSALLAACGGSEPTPTPAPQPSPTPAASQQPSPTPAAATSPAPSTSPTVAATKPQKTLRVGFAISKSGPYAAGAGITIYPNYVLWAKDVNDAGGIELDDGIYTIELIEYDDQSSPEEAIKAIQRLVQQDKVDLLLPPWGTAMNLAVAPVFHQLGYPQLGVANLSDKTPELVKQWPGYFTFLGTSSQYSEAIADLLNDLAAQGKIGKKVALIHVDDEFGLELSAAAREKFQKTGFELVYDQGYPLGTADFQPILTDIKQRQPDAFVACSYPADTLALPQAAMVLDFNPPVFLTAVGTAFPIYLGQFGDNAEGVMGLGGINPKQPGLMDYYKRHKQVTGQDPDRWASPICYASLQVLQQALQRVGKVDRQAITKEIATGSFETIIGTIKLEGNIYYGNWLLGQWRNGEFLALWPKEKAAASPVVPKPSWKK